ncbi:MAG: type III-A CRISPR-associated protein Csm2 [Deltaproteobacteria bacterium]|jgi:CRISPR-associated protein Csm2|nr:type III-A CRISPR-associated protein Csm2 [Deltaproteobacteria bacterium]MDX9761312.1 type III-A CRISPR-associated protein Csm2 [Desulfomonilia bacterium]
MIEKLEPLNKCCEKYGHELADLESVSIDRIVQIADEVGSFLVRGKYKKFHNSEGSMGIKVNQIRRFLDAVRRIEASLKKGNFEQIKGSVILLRPKLAYAAGREEKIKPLMNVLDPAIKSGAESRENFEKLLRLIEGIIAYHSYYGGTN